MKTYGQFCPVAMALEVVGERWSLLVIRELLAGSERFSELLRGLPRIPRSMLSRRLRTLEEAGLVERTDTEESGVTYALTDAGRALEDSVCALGLWGRRWLQTDMADEHLDASLLLWDMQRRIDADAVPDERVVLRFELSGGAEGYERFWLKIDHGEADVCRSNPGFDESLVVSTDLRVLTEVWMGHRSFRRAIRERTIRVEGAGRLAKELPDWFRLNTFAELDRAPRATR
jgi:DNA-binding HxlR family transcriptional regulator